MSLDSSQLNANAAALSEPTDPVIVVPPLHPTAEPGYATTEFYVSVVSGAATEVVTVVAAFGLHVSASEQTAIIAAGQAVVGLISTGYAVARGLRKRGTTN